MANESNVVTVTVILQPGGITRQGFGIPLILSNTGNAWGTPELVRTYADIDSVEADFATTTPEYQAANALFAQPIKPALIMIGKGPSKPTQIKDLSISSVVAGQAYTVNVYSDGALQQVSYTAEAAAAWQASHAYTVGQLISNDTGKFYICITAGTSAAGPATGPSGTNANITDGTAHWMYSGAGAVADASNDAIVYNLQNALNALAAPAANFTATLSGSVGSKILVSTGDAAGNWFALEPLASGDISAVSNLMAIVDVTTNPGVASDLADILSANSAWYALVLLFKSAAIVATPSTGAAAWCESNERLLLASFSDTASATTAYSGGTDALHTLAAAGYSYTAGMWHPRDYEWFDAAKLGYFLPLEPGSDNWRLKTLSGVTALSGGAYDPATGNLALTVAGGPLNIMIGKVGDTDGLTQLSDSFAPVSITKDGSPVGNLAGVEVDEHGYLTASYDTGFVRRIYQIPLVDVPNINGLTSLSNQTYQVSPSSGSFFLWDAGTGPTGKVVGYAREELSGKRMQDITHPSDLPANTRLVAAISYAGRPRPAVTSTALTRK